MMAILRCGMLLSMLLYQLLATAVAQNPCVYSVGTSGICRPFADCEELHHKVIFPNDACEANTFCCPNYVIMPPHNNNIKINKLEPNPIRINGNKAAENTQSPPFSNTIFTPVAREIVEGKKKTYINAPRGILFNTVGQPPIVVNTERPTRTTPKPITTTTEAIPNLTEEFYKRLGWAFGNKYNPYHQQNVVTPHIDVETSTVSVIIEEVTTNTSSFMSNLNQLGLRKLSLQKCGFVHIESNPSKSNTEANLLEFPWLALLRYNSDSRRPNFTCGGSLITERWVLTAASCIRETLIGVRLGEYKITDKSQKDCVRKACSIYKDYKIAISVKHADYKPETGIKDIALIKLKTKVDISKNIKTICLPTRVEHFNVPYDNEPLTISGWGLKKEGATEVMKKHAIIRSKSQVCHQAYPEQRVEQSKLCLTTRYEEPSTCSGDHGGPIIWLVNDNTEFFTQIGVVPFGMDKCGAADGVVSSYYIESVADSMDWITKVIGED